MADFTENDLQALQAKYDAAVPHACAEGLLEALSLLIGHDDGAAELVTKLRALLGSYTPPSKYAPVVVHLAGGPLNLGSASPSERFRTLEGIDERLEGLITEARLDDEESAVAEHNEWKLITADFGSVR